MKKFEINFYNTWGWAHFDLFSYDFFPCKTATYLEVTLLNFELDMIFRSDKQVKEQKKWDREMAKRNNEWLLEDFAVEGSILNGKFVEKKVKVSKKKAVKKTKKSK